ncbi:hypothetical protein D7294_01290 [Streptomyces hoynatensis]|uniref:Uncharacterized protein n=2 Tax=Streptomyces hoynatensis TaxID=1141874 RepID=A0A3A9ZHQ2_9ACTN|nr:hypothetical protein D7294_01290 [Streptomyces hoynatensis]
MEGLRVRDGALVTGQGHAVRGLALHAGEHLRPGAAYAVGGAEGLTLLAWDRREETAVRYDAVQPEQQAPGGGTTPPARAVSELRLRSAERPRRLELTLQAGLTRPDGRRRRLRWFLLRGELDLERWWQSAAGATGGAPLTLRMRHPLLRAVLTATPRPGPEGDWWVDVVTTIQGRGLVRPVAAVPLRATRGLLRRGLGDALGRLAEDWRASGAPLFGRPPDEVVAELLSPAPPAER